MAADTSVLMESDVVSLVDGNAVVLILDEAVFDHQIGRGLVW